MTIMIMLAAGLAAGCGAGGAEDLSWCGHSPSGSSLFPTESMEDWKSYSDHLAVVSIFVRQAVQLEAAGLGPAD